MIIYGLQAMGAVQRRFAFDAFALLGRFKRLSTILAGSSSFIFREVPSIAPGA
jgi:hypothetical protein